MLVDPEYVAEAKVAIERTPEVMVFGGDFMPRAATDASRFGAAVEMVVMRSDRVLGRAIDLPGLLDESHGRHPRRTSWLWAAGAGISAAGAPVFWNLVEGMFEGECAVWVDGEPHLVGRLPFDGLHGVGDLRFEARATRAKRENYLVLASDYEQPFGEFAGSLPVAGELAGHGVMERHEALW